MRRTPPEDDLILGRPATGPLKPSKEKEGGIAPLIKVDTKGLEYPSPGGERLPLVMNATAPIEKEPVDTKKEAQNTPQSTPEKGRSLQELLEIITKSDERLRELNELERKLGGSRKNPEKEMAKLQEKWSRAKSSSERRKIQKEIVAKRIEKNAIRPGQLGQPVTAQEKINLERASLAARREQAIKDVSMFLPEEETPPSDSPAQDRDLETVEDKIILKESSLVPENISSETKLDPAVLLAGEIATEGLFRSNDMKMDSTPNETLSRDSEAVLEPTAEIEAYFARLDPQYRTQLESLNSAIGVPMDPETRLVVCIPVAGHQEANNIYQTLESYSMQKRNPEEFEILLFVNAPETAQTEKRELMDKTMSEIEKARKQFQNLKIRVAQTFIPEDQVRIGNIRKIGTDLALLRQQLAGIKTDLILLSNDADNQGISEEYIDAYIKYFEEHPEKEGAVGNLQFDPNAFIRFPVIHLRQEFTTFLDQVGFQNGNVTLFGTNSCMKSSIYAAIGGYPPGLKTGEQEWTGKTIRKLRKKRSTLGFVKDSLLVTSSRRAVASSVLGTEGEIEFGNQETEAKMRVLNLESLPIFDYANKEALGNLRKELEQAINQLIEIYDKGEGLGKDAPYYRNNLEKVGIQYAVDNNGVIHITNMDRFIARQEVMQRMIKGGEKNMARVIEASLEVKE